MLPMVLSLLPDLTLDTRDVLVNFFSLRILLTLLFIIFNIFAEMCGNGISTTARCVATVLRPRLTAVRTRYTAVQLQYEATLKLRSDRSTITVRV